MRCLPHEAALLPPECRECDLLSYGKGGWKDRHGDVWRLAPDGLMHSFETRPFPPAFVQKKWGPLRPVDADGS